MNTEAPVAREEFEDLKGRINGLQVGLYVIATALPLELAKMCAQRLQEHVEPLTATALASPLQDVARDRMLSVVNELVAMLLRASDRQG